MFSSEKWCSGEMHQERLTSRVETLESKYKETGSRILFQSQIKDDQKQIKKPPNLFGGLVLLIALIREHHM